MISLFCLGAASASVSGSLALSSGMSVFGGSTSCMPLIGGAEIGVDRQALKKNGVNAQSSSAVVRGRVGFLKIGFIVVKSSHQS
jgi:hypothetical protein